MLLFPIVSYYSTERSITYNLRSIDYSETLFIFIYLLYIKKNYVKEHFRNLNFFLSFFFLCGKFLSFFFLIRCIGIVSKAWDIPLFPEKSYYYKLFKRSKVYQQIHVKILKLHNWNFVQLASQSVHYIPPLPSPCFPPTRNSHDANDGCLIVRSISHPCGFPKISLFLVIWTPRSRI